MTSYFIEKLFIFSSSYLTLFVISGPLAHPVEHLTLNQRVASSSLAWPIFLWNIIIPIPLNIKGRHTWQQKLLILTD